MLGRLRAEIQARTQRERVAWNSKDIVEAQGFKYRIHAAFENSHSRRLENTRAALIAERCRGATVLDYGCYEGEETRRYLSYGVKRVVGIDISDAAISKARLAIQDPRAQFCSADAHFLPFAAGVFDLVVGRAILHHVDLRVAFAEIARVLKTGGTALFVEPLFGNPIARLVRLLTPRARTKDEKPLDRTDILLGETIIGAGRHAYTGLVSVPVGVLASLAGASKYGLIMKAAALGDDLIAHTPLRYWGRMVFLTYTKSHDRVEASPLIGSQCTKSRS